MTSRLIELPEAEGRLLATVVLEPGGKKILARGHRLEPADLHMLKQRGLRQVWVVELDAGDQSEDAVLDALAPGLASGPLEVRRAAGGRVDLIALETSALVVDTGRLQAFNESGAAVCSTTPQFSLVQRQERFATLRSMPFAAPGELVTRFKSELETKGPLVRVKPIRDARVSVIYTDPASPERARELFEPIVRRRMERYGAPLTHRTCLEQETALVAALADTLRRPAGVVLIASTVSPLTPADAIGRAIQGVGGKIVQFLAPVEPGSLLLLGYAGETAIVAATGCFRSPKANVLDLILPPLLARHPLTQREVAALGPGGLLG